MSSSEGYQEAFDYGVLHIYVSKRAPRRLTEVIITKRPEAEQTKVTEEE